MVCDGTLEVPAGFRAVVIQRSGDATDDGHRVPTQPDGMTCLADRAGRWVLLRNHELGTPASARSEGIDPDWHGDAPPPGAYRQNMRGAVLKVTLDPAALKSALDGTPGSPAVLGTHVVLSGTDNNCSGGTVVTGDVAGWVSCEESDAPDHGWAFLARVDDDVAVDAASRRLTSWGRFKHEAIAFDPTSGIVYMSEDHAEGLLYRHVPSDPADPFGPGMLEALRVPGLAHSDAHRLGATVSEPPWSAGTRRDVQWLPIEDPTAASSPCRVQGRAAGATAFTRGEGIARDPVDGAIVFVASLGGPAHAGQVFRLTANELQLLAEVEDRSRLSAPDNITIAPWGDLIVCEDNYDGRGIEHQHVRGLRSDGSVYDIVKNLQTQSGGLSPDASPPAPDAIPPGAEFSGCCFSPDGEVLFVNLMSPVNATVAVRGDWERLARAAR